jgi:hypothetical protein
VGEKAAGGNEALAGRRGCCQGDHGAERRCQDLLGGFVGWHNPET